MTYPAVRNIRRGGRGRGSREARSAIIDPLHVSSIFTGGIRTPDIMEWVLSDEYLDQRGIYPKQATLLKCIFLQDELFTDFDLNVIGEWGEEFARTGNHGCQPDLLERIRICKAQGRPWFREIIAVIGRRGSKGFLGAISGSYVLWNFMHRPGGPQTYYGIERSKKLVAIVFAGKKSQAKENQWRDLTNVIIGAPCFAPYISRPLGEILTVYAPSDIIRAQRQRNRGVDTDADQATFELVPRESSLMAGRGPTSFMQFYDEMAHVVATGINRSAEEVYNAATPSLDQFGNDGFIYAGSSPWQMTGRYFQMWEEAIAHEPDGSPSYPEKFMVQLKSWDPYGDWDNAEQIIVRPPRKLTVVVEHDISAFETAKIETQVDEPPEFFAEKHNPIQAYDANMRQLEKSNPDNFAVERLSHWAAVIDSYLDAKRVEEVFQPWQGQPLRVQERGVLSVDYKAHGDPGEVNDAFGYSIAHVEIVDEIRELPDGKIIVDPVKHVVFDVVHCWEPADYPEHQIDYIEVGDEIFQYLHLFMPFEQTFDQFNSVEAMQRLRKSLATAKHPKRTAVYKVDANANGNWVRAEIFKSAINLGRVHAPMLAVDGSVNEPSARAELELRFLQRKNKRVDHPTSGPVQSKDVADTMFECVWALIGQDLAKEIGMELMALGIGTGTQGGANPYGAMTDHGSGRGDVADVADQFRRSVRGQNSPSPANRARGGRPMPGRRGW